ncbi:MAG: Spy/CpxP family protein refolding chaperone [Bryobacterales bacterium]|nr:Spy/CpxP family protein refolding chaperone [Bryobacterales bacterium]
MKRTILAAILGTALSAGAIFAQQATTLPAPAEQQHHQGQRAGNRGGMLRMFRALNLSDTQKQQIRGIMQQTREANADTREQLKALRTEERDAIKSGASEAQLQSLANNAAPLIAKMHASRLVAKSKIYAVLTPEQRQKADEMRSQFGQRFQKRQKPQQN